MDLHRLRQRCEARQRALALPTPFDVDAFCTDLAARRCRPIVLFPLRRAGDVTGLWIGLSSVDLIAYAAGTSALHQEHIILHELSHLLCGHQPALADVDIDAFSFLGGEIDLQDVEIGARQHVLYRVGYTTEEEQEAEMLASLILEHAVHTRTGMAMPSSRAAARPLAPLDAILEEGVERSA